MLFRHYASSVVAFWTPISGASPAGVDRSARRELELLAGDHPQLEKRLAAGFSLEQTLQNETLFDG